MKLAFEETIRAPQRVVWELITDLHGAPARISSIVALEVLTHGPVGRGTRFRETRVMFGRKATEELEVTQFDAPHTYTVEADSCGVRFVSTYTLRESGGTTVLRLDIRTAPRTLFAKLMAPLGALFAGAMRKEIARDNAELRQAAEARAGHG